MTCGIGLNVSLLIAAATHPPTAAPAISEFPVIQWFMDPLEVYKHYIRFTEKDT